VEGQPRAAVYAFLTSRLCVVYGAKCRMETMIVRPQAARRQMEDIMATTIFLGLCIAAAGFMLYCLFHFGQELRHGLRSSSHDDLWVESSKLNVAPVHVGGPISMAIWSEGTWHRILSSTHDSKPRNLKGKGATRQHYDVAA
jgi:hypothetical protein